MSKKAWFYISFTYISGFIFLLIAYMNYALSFAPSKQIWLEFGILTLLMTLSQLFRSEAPSHQLYHPNLMFAFSGVLLLPPFLFALMILVSHFVEWIKERLTNSPHLQAWYLQPFNICMHIIIGFITHTIILFINPLPNQLGSLLGLTSAIVAAISYTALNHTFVGIALLLARGISIKDSGILDIENLSTDFVMLTMGYINAILMDINPLLAIPALTPLYLIYRALAVPRLRLRANTDPKTSLWNADFFNITSQAELNRAKRFERTLSVIMSDLDLLRNINNTYGHLAGDAVLIGIAEILRTSLREYDIVARFGGEEFAILMPEISPDQAFERVEIIRKKIEKTEFQSLNQEKIRITMSFGISGLFPEDESIADLIQRADMAVYEAKIKGRNCTCIYSPETPKALGMIAQVDT
jgi:diguanylate cyclase (GGDEF)-like protein